MLSPGADAVTVEPDGAVRLTPRFMGGNGPAGQV